MVAFSALSLPADQPGAITRTGTRRRDASAEGSALSAALWVITTNRSRSLPNDVAIRLQRIAGSRLTNEGVIVITANRHRSQERNRDDARARLIEMIVEAANPPPPRRATKPTKASKTRRLDSKSRRGHIKKMRSNRDFD